MTGSRPASRKTAPLWARQVARPCNRYLLRRPLPAALAPNRTEHACYVLCVSLSLHEPCRAQALNAPNYGGLGVNMKGMTSFGAFVAPPMNGALFINDTLLVCH